MFNPLDIVRPSKLSNPFIETKTISESGMATFGDVLKNAINSANSKLVQAGDVSRKVASGEIKDINQVVFAWHEAGLTLKMMRSITQKLIEGAKTLFQTNI
ncbi:MAG: flagellar hook-basal body complex protein FliE [Candidatus Calescibacterium sp.]|nr:flagellar hook-basal body complex protein FliE [Candidatus Calescibacterium sp.]MCX7972277.1 flagellar hook-basal body complex protein FliE [bacterium]MDW8195120.1 flagellar hook-basal body complex protein FliE [Candidatus Calescibacterium sp.]